MTAGRVPGVYAAVAGTWDRERPRALPERVWIDRALERLPAGAEVLDLGCGTGTPIGGYVLSQGFHLTGVDVARPMVEIAQRRYPDATWIVADMAGLNLSRRFDAILAWDSYFHLPPDAQRAMFDVFAAHITPGGRLLMTTGPRAGEVMGQVGGRAVYHASLAPSEYRAEMARTGFAEIEFVAEDPRVGQRSVWLAEAAS